MGQLASVSCMPRCDMPACMSLDYTHVPLVTARLSWPMFGQPSPWVSASQLSPSAVRTLPPTTAITPSSV